jgi:hypothetical protein
MFAGRPNYWPSAIMRGAWQLPSVDHGGDLAGSGEAIRKHATFQILANGLLHKSRGCVMIRPARQTGRCSLTPTTFRNAFVSFDTALSPRDCGLGRLELVEVCELSRRIGSSADATANDLCRQYLLRARPNGSKISAK